MNGREGEARKGGEVGVQRLFFVTDQVPEQQARQLTRCFAPGPYACLGAPGKAVELPLPLQDGEMRLARADES